MLTEKKAMDIPRHVLSSYFRDTTFPLIQHHLDSYNDLIEKSIPAFIKASNPFPLELPGKEPKDNRSINVYIGGKEGDKIKFYSPTDEAGNAIVPHGCRLDNLTYALELRADIDIEYVFGDKTTEVKSFNDISIGKIPLMLRSNYCYLSVIPGYDIGECKFELGGYFIIDGSEKILLTQELLGDNMIYAGSRDRKSIAAPEKATLVETEKAIEVKAEYEDDKETYVGLRAISEDGSVGPFYHFITIPPPTAYFTRKELEKTINLSEMTDVGQNRFRRVAMINIRGFQQPVPLLSVFRALGVTSDKDLYNIILAGIPDKQRLQYDDIFYQLVLSHQNFFSETNDFEILKNFTRTKSKSEVAVNILQYLFPHMEGEPEGMLIRKSYMLGYMTLMGLNVSLGIGQKSDRDNFRYKRFDTSGVLCFQEFRRCYREIARDMLLKMDSRIQYESKRYEGKGLSSLIEPETIGYYWRKFKMLASFEKAFKGLWGGKSGISQELSRSSYAGVISHLRKTSLQIDKSISTAPPRKLYASQWGLTCPTDSPDGSDIGYIKGLTIFAHISTAFPRAKVVEVLKSSSPHVLEVRDIIPATWQPHWSKIFINMDLYAVCTQNTEELYQTLKTSRREGKLDKSVSLAWNRLNNELHISCDAGRPIRPIYREGTTPDMIRNAVNWEQIASHLDYVDAQETDTLLISMEPFHSTLPSEIHMSFNLSALANLVPYADHNPSTRNKFSIAQQKQASSWFHTNYKKRFDTIAMMICEPQKPISHTWMYREMMGAGGCMPYGFNALVAITTYTGFNQEDSVIMNESSIERGMYRTLCFHNYDVSEDMVNMMAQTHTEFGNLITNPIYGEVKRKEGMDYSKLDDNGIIKVNSIIDDNTILVGILSPVTGENGQVSRYRDVSAEPKRGQRGRVDAVYTYTITRRGQGIDEEGNELMISLRGVKIRIVEERQPILGDKFSSRHSQKGTVGIVLKERDMPFTSSGLRPDIIFNPHALPTRMTVGQFVESASNKLGIHLGSFMDATPFTTSKRIKDVTNALVARGFEPYGSEIMYNGMTGEMMEADIFMGPVYYQALKQMVEDKINYRSTGPKALLTHQPTQGRSNDGGMRIGEMERDSILAHGMSKFLTESLMERSDKNEFQFDRESGHLDTSKDMISMPYSMGLFARELESLHIEMKMITE